jgi:osomolarity two-component system sensor histidine kinase NIK1
MSKQIEVDARGEILDLKNTVNGMVIRYGHNSYYGSPLLICTSIIYRLRALAAEVTRVTLEVGQAHVPGVEGVWLNLIRNVSVFSFV